MVRLTCLAVALLLVSARPAAAATVSLGPPAGDYFSGPSLDYRAAPGEHNQVALSVAADRSVTVRDVGATVAPGAGCASVDAHTARCSTLPGVATIESGAGGLGDPDDR